MGGYVQFHMADEHETPAGLDWSSLSVMFLPESMRPFGLSLGGHPRITFRWKESRALRLPLTAAQLVAELGAPDHYESKEVGLD